MGPSLLKFEWRGPEIGTRKGHQNWTPSQIFFGLGLSGKCSGRLLLAMVQAPEVEVGEAMPLH